MPNQDISLITPEILNSNHSLLTHKRGKDSKTIQQCDGLVGAVVADGHFFVTSPNMTVVYEPPFGNRDMRFRDNFRYGADDPLQWPQPFILSDRHLAAIPLPSCPGDPTEILWWTPTADSFEPCTTNIISGVGLMNKQRCRELHDAALSVLDRVARLLRKTPDKIDHIVQISKFIEQGMRRLQTLPMSESQVMIAFCHIQRLCLEAIAMMDYIEIFIPRMRGSAACATSAENRMGAFTHDPLLAEEFVRAGLPIWLIRPYSELPHTRIDSVVEVRKPSNFFSLIDASPQFRTFFRGAADCKDRYTAFYQHVRSIFSYANPFSFVPPSLTHEGEHIPSSSTTHRQSDPSHAKTSATSAIRTPRTKSARDNHPYPRASPNTCGGRNKFREEPNPLIPPSIPAWQNALANVNTDPRNQEDCFQSPMDAGYIFPEPGILYGGLTPERQAQLILSWLKQRPAWLFRMSSSDFASRPISNQNWRTMLTYGDSPPPARRDTKSSRRRVDMQELLGSCLTEAGVTLTRGKGGDIFWREQSLLSGVLPSHETCQEILWELFELGFRFELFALDHRARVHDEDETERLNRILACFPGKGPLVIVDYDLANQGLGAPTISQRAPYLLALQDVMKRWKGDIPRQITREAKPVDQYSNIELHTLEHAAARFYTQSFFNYFGRAAIVPHSLNIPSTEKKLH